MTRLISCVVHPFFKKISFFLFMRWCDFFFQINFNFRSPKLIRSFHSLNFLKWETSMDFFKWIFIYHEHRNCKINRNSDNINEFKNRIGRQKKRDDRSETYEAKKKNWTMKQVLRRSLADTFQCSLNVYIYTQYTVNCNMAFIVFVWVLFFFFLFSVLYRSTNIYYCVPQASAHVRCMLFRCLSCENWIVGCCCYFFFNLFSFFEYFEVST